MKKKILLVLTIFSFLAYSQNSCTLDETKLTGTFTTTTVGGTKIKASDATAQHEFGERVAIDGNIAVASSRSNEAAEGKVYVFINDGSGNWTQQTILKASDGFAGDNFGSSVAIEGNYLIVGARSQTNVSAVDTGAAYLFEYNGVDTWTEVAVFEPSDGSSGDRFGESVSIEGNLILIGSRDGCVGGCAYLYENDGTNTFTYSETKLEPQVQSNYSGARFGYAALVKDGRAYVGGARDYSSVGNAHSGSVQIWDQANDGTWTRTHRLRGTESTEFFGCSLSVEGDYLVIGALNYENSVTPEADQGRVFVYKADSNGDYLDTNRVMIQNSDKDSFTDQRFGSAVALENGYLYVGARGDSGEPNSDAVYIFKDDGTNNWTQFSKVITGDSVGYFSNNALSVSYPNMIVGQPRDHFPSNSGAIHFVPLASAVTPTASITGTTGAFIGQNNATITLNFSDEATRTEIQFSVDGGVTYPYIFNDDLGTSDITNLGIGTYDLKARFNNGSCELDLGTVTINQATYTAIPDANFEARLEALGYDDISDDGQVPTDMIEIVTSLDVSHSTISDMTGIEDFTALEVLNCKTNPFETLDVSNNTQLKSLTSSSGRLDEIDVTNNPLLEVLDVSANDDIAVIDLSNNPLLRELTCNFNSITSLDFSSNPNLEIAIVYNNNLSSLDLSTTTKLVQLDARNNNLTSLNVKNGNNTNMTLFDARSNSGLFCINVDDISYSTTNWTNINTGMVFSNDGCRYTQIPDSTFEARLEELGYDDVSGDGQVPTRLIEVVTSLGLTELGINDLTGIEDFTTLKTLNANGNNFTSLDVSENTLLETLFVNSNNISSIDVSNNTALKNLAIGSNGISTLDVSNNLALRDLYVQGNGKLTSLDLSNNVELRELYTYSSGISSLDLSIHTELRIFSAYKSSLTSIDLSNNDELRSLRVDETNVTALDLSNNTKLETLRINDTGITTLDLSNQPALINLWAHDTNLTSLNVQNGNNINVNTFNITNNPGLSCINVDDASYSTTNWTNIDSGMYFTTYGCRYTQIPDTNFEARLNALGYDDIANDGQVPTDLIEVVTELQLAGQNITDLTGIEDFKALEELKANGNDLTNLNLSNNTALKLVWVTSNANIGAINLTNNPLLEDLRIQYSGTSIDISKLSALDRFGCTNCGLTSLNTSDNTNLRWLDLENTPVTSLDLTSNSKLEILEIDKTSLVELNLSSNTALEFIYAENITTLTGLNIQNGTNTNIKTFETVGTPVPCIKVDDVTYSTTNWTDVDPLTTFNQSGYCLYTQIPDANFEAELNTLGYDDIVNDGKVPTALIEVVTSLDVSNKNIVDLTGIEDFTSLVTLNCADNNLTTVDVSNNTALETINALDNQITSIDISQNTSLKSINLGNNPISSLDFSNNNLITRLECNGTNISSLDITNLTQLDYLEAFNTGITSIDLSQNTVLRVAQLQNTNIATIDVSTNTGLTHLWLNNTLLTSLDLTTNTILQSLRTWETSITELDLSNQTSLLSFYGQNGVLEKLNVQNGNNTNILTGAFNTKGNPNLTCILVDDPSYSNTNWTNIDVTTSFSNTYCEYTTITDANFEAALNNLGYDDIANDGQVPTSLIESVTTLDVSNQNIADLTGIQDFTALTDLNVETNVLTSLNLSSNVNLQNLNFDYNTISNLNLGSISKLISIEARYNQLTTIDLSQSPDLSFINIRNNLLTSIDITNNPLLENITLRGNSNLTTINTSNNPNLKYLYFQDTGLTGLDVSQNPLLEIVIIERVNFNAIDVSNLSALRQLRITDNNFTSLDVSNNPALERLECDNNNLTYLNLQNGNNTNMSNGNFKAAGNPSLTCIRVDDATWSTTNWTNIDNTAGFSDTYCEYTSIPDATFEAELEALGYDDISGDGQVPTKLIEVVTSLNLNDIGISDLTGIEDFTTLVTLNARGNNFTSLDVSNNILLETLTVNTNNLTTIDVSKNVALRILNLGTNLFTSVDVSKNVNLRDLFVQGNSGLTTLDISNNTQLQKLYTTNTSIATLDLSLNSDLRLLEVYKSPIASIDLSNNPNLTSLRVDETNITEIDLTNNINIETLRVNDTGIQTLDLSKLTSLEKLWAHDTSLNYLNVKNGNNSNVLTFRIENNSSLSCAIVDDASYSTTNWTDIPTGLVFSTTYCDYTSIPDANFEAALEALGYDDISGDGQVPTVLIEVVEDLTIVSKAIADITGIEDFKALKTLNCAGNTFTNLDLSNNTNVTSVITKFTPLTALNISNSPNLDILVCSFNDLSALDVSKNTALTYLECNNNNLKSLDISLNTALLDLRCGSNSLTVIDVTNNTALTSFWCQDNSITDLDLSNQTKLVSITVNDNNLTSLNVKNGNNTNVTNFIATGNINLTCINVDDATYSTTNWLGIDDTANFSNTGCSYTQIPDANFEAELEALGYDDISGDGQVPTYLIEVVTSLALPNKGISDLTGIEDFVALTSLNCRVNNLTALDVTQNTLLKTLTSDGNSLTSIDLSNNTDLEILNLAGSNLTSLDLTNNTLLRKLLLNGNGGLTSLDISNNTKLVEFKAYATNIAALDFSVHPDLETLECYGTQISTVDFSNNPELRVLRVDNTNITELDLSNNPNIETLRVNDTGIASLDLSKQIVLKNLYAHETNLSYLNVKNGNNTNVTTFRAENNPNLTCIVVDNATYSTTNWTDIDGTASFTNNYCRYTAIPDANFESALESLGYDDISADGQVPTALIEGITTLDVKNLSITDFTGIENFVGLTSLDVGNNNAGSIDITNLVLLEFVRLDAMSLTSIDLSKNTALVDLRCSFNSGITSIDVSNNTLLETAHVGNNSLSNIDLSNNTLLYELRMSNNNLTSVDLSNNTALTELNLSNNELSYLNLKNANNTNILIFYSTGNPLLSCVLVDDANYSTTNWTNIDDTTSFRDTDYCNYTAIPDSNFEARLEAFGYDDISGDGQVPTALIETITSLTINKQSITDFTGIQDFKSLTYLDAGNNSAGSIDISNLVLLEFVRLDAMSLSSIDLSKNTALTDLRCSYNSGMTSIDISKNTLLETAHISNNSLSSVDVSNNPLLYELRAASNDLTTIDVSANTALLGLNLSNNPNLTSLDLANNTVLKELSATNCGLNSVTSINTTDLEEVRLSNNNLTSLDVSNSIASIFELYVGENNLTSLDVTGAVRLFTLSAYSNSITNLDLSTATSIEIINVSYNNLSSLNLKNGKNNLVLSFNAENNAALNCILVDDAEYSTTRWSDIDDTTNFSDTHCGSVQVAIKAYLQGAFINPNSGEESLMRDDLRVSGGVYGSTSPYSDSATISDAIKLDNVGANSMVDWVWVELRDATNPNTIIAGKSGILQRNGDIVTTDDGSSPLYFDVSSDNYYIVIKHRNHLSIMTSSVISLSTTTTTVDLASSSTAVSGGSNAITDMGNGIFAMIAGDFDENGQVQNSDTNAVIQQLGLSGYNKADIDMNGQVQNSDINNLLSPNIGKGEQLINSID
ncbi:hypothetical protein [Tenacibaculum agarivorans]|uniref:hypothetical protein n=1 Tax=Tenacibaculum agarivorans TaxID=1908389 RepID=UPI00094B830B|nr:hypothetical protein [Tenacibaculum agarivorans]